MAKELFMLAVWKGNWNKKNSLEVDIMKTVCLEQAKSESKQNLSLLEILKKSGANKIRK
jgi:hypothetical protein